ncbi:unnamed protein product, partial [Callosobruchus maculatus]
KVLYEGNLHKATQHPRPFFFTFPFFAISFLRLSPITASASAITLHGCYIAIAFTCLVARTGSKDDRSACMTA